MFKQNLNTLVEKIILNCAYLLQKGNDQKHTSSGTKQYFAVNKIQLVDRLAGSQDLNHIPFMGAFYPKDKEENTYFNNLNATWNNQEI